MSKDMLPANEITELLKGAPVGYLGLAKDEVPYVIPINFAYDSGNIYLHCAREGRKIDYLKVNRRACFYSGEIGGLVAADSPCKHSFSYRSVIIEGHMEEVTIFVEKEAALRAITAKYAGPVQAKKPLGDGAIDAVKVFRLVPLSMSGKKSP